MGASKCVDVNQQVDVSVWVSAYMRERERNVCVKHSSCNLALFNVL